MAKLRLENSLDVLDLNEEFERGTGVQALSGVTGFGLPPVSVQWSDGAGDGSTYRGRRVLAQDYDIPLDIVGRDRDHFKSLVSRLAMMLSDECKLVFEEDDGTEWHTMVVRTGGGQFVYGKDHAGGNDLQTVITLRAGDPYVESAHLETRELSNSTGVTRGLLPRLAALKLTSSQSIGTITLDNTAGDAHAYPDWQVFGPGNNFQAVSPTGETLHWTGTLLAGERLDISTKLGTITDGTGANRYAELAPAPRFWSIPPGISTVEASLQGVTNASKIKCSWRPRKWMVV